MSISHGVFVPGWLGTFPKEYTQSDIHPYLGSGLPDVEASEDPFIQWETMHPWLLDTHAREALNTYDFRVHRPPTTGRPLTRQSWTAEKTSENSKRRHSAFTPPPRRRPDDAPARQECVGDPQFGGKRNYGTASHG